MGIKTDRAHEEVFNYLKSTPDTALDVAKEINSYSGGCDWVDTWDLEELCHCMDAYEVVRAVIYGNVTNVCDDVRFDGYANLESVDEYDLKREATDYVGDYIDEAIELYECNNISINDEELKELIDTYIEIRDEEDEEE